MFLPLSIAWVEGDDGNVEVDQGGLVIVSVDSYVRRSMTGSFWKGGKGY